MDACFIARDTAEPAAPTQTETQSYYPLLQLFNKWLILSKGKQGRE